MWRDGDKRMKKWEQLFFKALIGYKITNQWKQKFVEFFLEHRLNEALYLPKGME